MYSPRKSDSASPSDANDSQPPSRFNSPKPLYFDALFGRRSQCWRCKVQLPTGKSTFNQYMPFVSSKLGPTKTTVENSCESNFSCKNGQATVLLKQGVPCDRHFKRYLAS